MTDRERLIELLASPTPIVVGGITVGEKRLSYFLAENIADKLLANGVIVPPCVVYNAAYHQYQIITKTRQGYMVSEKTYHTRKEAKKALAGRSEP